MSSQSESADQELAENGETGETGTTGAIEGIDLTLTPLQYHYLSLLQRLVALFPDDIRLLSAFLEGRMIAGLAIFDANPEVTLTFYISHDEAYQEYRAVNLLFYEFISKAIAGGFKYLDFGTFSLNMQPNFGLARFKESFGSSGLFRETMTIALGPDG